MSDVATRPDTTSRRKSSAPVVLVGGVVVVPTLLTFVFNSWEAPDAEAFVRMAFASVAGATIAIVTAVAVLISRIRERFSTVAVFAVIAVVVVYYSVSAIDRAGVFLLTGLSPQPNRLLQKSREDDPSVRHSGDA